MINWRAVVVTVLLNAALINAAVIGFAARAPLETPLDVAPNNQPAINPD